MDDIDIAQEREEFFRDQALAARQKPPIHTSGLRTCRDCGGEIPEARRKAAPGCTRCVRCQSVEED